MTKRERDEAGLPVVPPDWKLLLTPNDVAALCGVGRDRVDEWLHKGDLRAFRSSGGAKASWFIPRDTLQEDLVRMATEDTERRHRPNLRSMKNRRA